MLLYALSVAVLRHGPYEVRLKGDCYSMRRQRGTTSTEMENSKKGGSQVPTSVFIQSSNFRPARITEPLTDFHTNHSSPRSASDSHGDAARLDATLLSSSRGQQSADTRIREDPDIKPPQQGV